MSNDWDQQQNNEVADLLLLLTCHQPEAPTVPRIGTKNRSKSRSTCDS